LPNSKVSCKRLEEDYQGDNGSDAGGRPERLFLGF
jgi:hypothetical protein